jgi:hypothetical protein
MNKDINVSINTPALTKLNLQGSIKSFNNTSAASKCTDITVKGITPQQVTLYLRNFPGYAKELKVELESSVK